MLELIDTGGSEGGGAGRHWVLDPIDGTRGFVGLRQYAICLGMIQDGQVGRSPTMFLECPRPSKLEGIGMLTVHKHTPGNKCLLVPAR